MHASAMRLVGLALHLVGLTLVVACAGGEDVPEGTGFDAGRFVVETPDPELDSGSEVDQCALLEQRACGPNGTECGTAGACEAARLLARYEPERCGASLSNPETFPECTADACTRLMEKTCGGAPEPSTSCATEPGCALAKDLYDDARDDDASADDRAAAREACAAGLEDAIVFPTCTGA